MIRCNLKSLQRFNNIFPTHKLLSLNYICSNKFCSNIDILSENNGNYDHLFKIVSKNTGKDLDGYLTYFELKKSGIKKDKIDRIINNFNESSLESLNIDDIKTYCQLLKIEYNDGALFELKKFQQNITESNDVETKADEVTTQNEINEMDISTAKKNVKCGCVIYLRNEISVNF